MGWSTATSIFDEIMDTVLPLIHEDSHITVMAAVAKPLLDADWDCENESNYWSPEMVQALQIAAPNFYDDEYVAEIYSDYEW